MDWEYVGGLLLSIAIFAPGVLILAVALVIGTVMALENAGVFKAMDARRAKKLAPVEPVATATNPPPGEVVSELKRALEPDAAEQRQRKVS